jgi:hypothetical protein
MNPRRRAPRSLAAEPGTRAAVPAAALRAAYEAHRAHAHHGRIGYRCRTCTRYAAAVTLAATRDELTDPAPAP